MTLISVKKSKVARKTSRVSPERSASRGLSPLSKLRLKYGISQSLLARLLDVSLRTISGIEGGSVKESQVARNFSHISRLCQALAEVMQADYVGTWLNGPNEMLDGLKPVEAIERGKVDLLWAVVEGLRHGSHL